MQSDKLPSASPELDPSERHAQDEFDVQGRAAARAREREGQAAFNTAKNTSTSPSLRERIGRLNSERRGESLARTATNAAVNSALNAAGPVGRAFAFIRTHRKTSIFGGIGLALLLLCVWLFVTLAPAGILVHAKEVGTRWMTKYQSLGVGRRSTKLMKQVYFGDKEQCTESKWRCRHNQGVSDKELDKLKERGFEVKTEERGNPKKKFITSMDFMNEFSNKKETVDVNNFEDFMRNNPGFRSKYHKIISPNGFNLRSKSVINKLVNKIGIDRRGIPEDEKDPKKITQKIRQLLYGRSNVEAGKADVTDTEYNQEGKPSLDVEDVEGVSEELVENADALNKEAIANGPPASSIPNPSGLLNGDESTLSKIGDTVTSGVKGGVKGALLGAFSGAEAYCSFYQVIRLLSLSMAVYGALELMQYAGLFLTISDQFKAGTLSAAAVSTIATAFLRQSTKAESKGKSFSDSLMVSLLQEGKIPDREAMQRFSVGGGFGQLLNRLKNFLDIGEVSPTVCKALGSPIGQIGLIMGGVISSLLTGGAGGALFGATVGAAKGVAMGMVSEFATPYLIQALAGTISPDLTTDPEGGFGIGNALPGGLIALGGAIGNSSAMGYLTNEEVAATESMTRQEQRTIAAVEKAEAREAGIFSLNNPMSLTNKMAQFMSPLLSSFTQGPQLSAVASQGASLIGKGFGALPSLLGSNAYAQEQEKIDYYRGDLCQDEAIKKHNLATTAVCGTLSGADPAVLSDDAKWYPKQVDGWMVANGYVDGETGEPNDEVKEFKEICIDSVGIPITEDGAGIDVGDKGMGDCLKREEKYTYFRQFLGYEIDDQSRKDAAEDKLGLGSSTNTPAGGTIDGDAKSLAQQVLDNKNIEFNDVPSEGRAARQSFEAVAKGEQATVDYNNTKTSISTSLMKAMLETAKTYRFRVGYTVNGDHGGKSRHYTGRAIDVNAINGQGPLQVDGPHRQIGREFSEHIAKFLPKGGGIGENNCMGPLNLPPGINYFYDTCNHLHIDVGDSAP